MSGGLTTIENYLLRAKTMENGVDIWVEGYATSQKIRLDDGSEKWVWVLSNIDKASLDDIHGEQISPNLSGESIQELLGDEEQDEYGTVLR